MFFSVLHENRGSMAKLQSIGIKFTKQKVSTLFAKHKHLEYFNMFS